MMVGLWVGATAGASGIEWAEVSDWRLLEAAKDANNWLTSYRTYNGWRYSPLSQINTETVRKLSPKWLSALGDVGAQEATPLVNDGVLVVTSPSLLVNRVIALDAATGQVLWKHETKLPEDLSGLVRILPHNRGVALYKDKIYFGTLDGRLIALPAATGRVAWETTLADYKDGYFISMAPLAAKGKVVVGMSGPGEMGPRGVIAGVDPETGEIRWRTFTIPAAGEAGAETWAEDSWKYGGGAVWLTGTYDPELNLLYFGVGNPAPWIAELRRGDNLYTNSVLALDADTGQLKWYFQYLPNDAWDLDPAHEHLLLDVKRDGAEIKATFQANKLGFAWMLDRRTGKFVRATPFARLQTIFKGVDPATGKVIENPGMRPKLGGPPLQVCPSLFGGRNWAHAAYNPHTGLVYQPSLELCMKYWYPSEIAYKRGALYIGAEFEIYTPLDRAGALRAIDPATGDIVWEWWNRAPLQAGGALTTGGGLVFVGTPEGRLVALNARSGEQLWEFQLGTPVTAPPIAYSVGGRQYVAVVAGGNKGPMDLWGKEPKLDHLKKLSFGGMLVVFGLPA
jgi:alcohol dehydrogenase (cytochrome c)